MFLFASLREIRRKVIFDLDRTLWRATIEYHPKIRDPRPFPGTYDVLERLSKQYSLNIASRSAEPDKCYHFLQQCFPTIHFEQIEIFPAKNKRKHIQNIIGFDDIDPFYLIDDEKHILDDIEDNYNVNTDDNVCTFDSL